MTELDMITDTIARLEATVEAAAAPLTEAAQPLTGAPEAPRAKRTKKPSPQSAVAPANPEARKKGAGATTTKSPRSKKAVLVGLLSRKSGATMQAMMTATGWQAHSVRAGLSGLRKNGFKLERRSNRKGETVYAIVEPSAV
ncbi:MAG: DUF3489 domain-containing protein [Rhizobiales bacterium]|nr:DUF3489 domain-containing protein [Hyphomicrobiales bacterium]MBO6700378.1 DUF3489 domain-containing protein [Hyphomicrobiales bacterium]MBO6737914.1 DUF3489 domain-containing protein [Hyphomicrobiales bacterium]MBO6913779.1 DUF3489 domain-containing protein [Hyphomicrobiales bacterium]MBO6954326.1 DUF3489 domain-containing protein [Hyphomicrobiales bacterium]